ncbi:miraculin-like [Prosopis cineraria]|uniref:miraculin-like n=1 Tax=Prosopis cineraria TaxID=364024 RepID=UPI00240EC1D4|nr:miraculin-like [Prosopis cineraria]
MKITLAAAFILLLAFSTKPMLGGSADAKPEPVLSGSKMLRAGHSYYIIPVPQPPSGGLQLASSRRKCPLDVITVQEDPSLPSSFVPVNSKDGMIRVSTDLNIVFNTDTDTGCPQSNVWKVDDYDNSTGQWSLTTGGVVGNPGPQTVRNWFKIEKYEDGYKLLYCPSVCRNCNNVPCKDIGTYIDSSGYEHLVLSDMPYKIQFL